MKMFVLPWLMYLLAFLLGSLTAWLLARILVKHDGEAAAFADLPNSHTATGSKR